MASGEPASFLLFNSDKLLRAYGRYETTNAQ